MSVIRWFIANPMRDAVHHGPIIDYLHDQRFVASVPNPLAHLPGQPGRLAPQPNLTMKGSKVTDAYDRETRLLTLEVRNASRQIVQARQKLNKQASPKELSIISRWASAGGPTTSKFLARRAETSFKRSRPIWRFRRGRSRGRTRERTDQGASRGEKQELPSRFRR